MQTLQEPQSVMLASEAADYLRTTKSTLKSWRIRNIGPRCTRVGRGVRYIRAELDRWLAEQTERGTSE